MPELELSLGLWQGFCQSIKQLWLRWYNAADNCLPTLAEREQQRAERKRQWVEELEAMLAPCRETYGELPDLSDLIA